MPVPTREPVPLGRSRRAHVPRANLVNWYTRRRSAAERQSGTVAMRQLAAREPARATNAGGAAARDECVGHARGRSIRSLRNRLLGGERRPWRPSLLAPAVPPSLLGRTAVAPRRGRPVRARCASSFADSLGRVFLGEAQPPLTRRCSLLNLIISADQQGREEREREREIIRVCAACSIISVLTQWGATLVIKLREREREIVCNF